MDQKTNIIARLIARIHRWTAPKQKYAAGQYGYTRESSVDSEPPVPSNPILKDAAVFDKLYDGLKSLDQNAPWYIIRFVDPSKEPEEVEEDVIEPWTRFYCEADLVRSIEAAEAFEALNDAISTAQILKNAKLSEHSMLESGPELFLMLRLLGLARIDMSSEYVPVVFEENMIIQVVMITETEVGYHSEVFWQDDYRWNWAADQEEEDEASDDEPGDEPVNKVIRN